MAALHAHSAFSFGSGPSSVAGLVLRAAELGVPALALTDTNSVTGIPELVRRWSIHPHRPPVPSGELVVFLTLEEESGMAQMTVPPEVYQACGLAIVTEPLLIVEGTVARRGAGNILLAQSVKSASDDQGEAIMPTQADEGI